MSAADKPAEPFPNQVKPVAPPEPVKKGPPKPKESKSAAKRVAERQNKAEEKSVAQLREAKGLDEITKKETTAQKAKRIALEAGCVVA